MDVIDLPVADDDTSLEDAIETMCRLERAGILYRGAEDQRVIDIDQVLHALQQGEKTRVAELTPRNRSLRATDILGPDIPEPETLGAEQPDAAERIVADDDTRRRVEDGLDERGATFALVQTRGERAKILSRHDPYRLMLHRPESVWKCKGAKRHYWKTSELDPGNRCPIDRAICLKL